MCIKNNCYILVFLIGKYSLDIKEDKGYINKYKVFEMGIFRDISKKVEFE